MPVCMALVELAITCEHDYMVVTVKGTKIYGKMILISGPSQLQLYQQLSLSRFPTYKMRGRRNGYRMFISI